MTWKAPSSLDIDDKKTRRNARNEKVRGCDDVDVSEGTRETENKVKLKDEWKDEWMDVWIRKTLIA